MAEFLGVLRVTKRVICIDTQHKGNVQRKEHNKDPIGAPLSEGEDLLSNNGANTKTKERQPNAKYLSNSHVES